MSRPPGVLAGATPSIGASVPLLMYSRFCSPLPPSASEAETETICSLLVALMCKSFGVITWLRRHRSDERMRRRC